jgi:hypothetical protein
LLATDKEQAFALALAKDEFLKEPAFISLAPATADEGTASAGSASHPNLDHDRPLTQGSLGRVPPPPTRRTK